MLELMKIAEFKKMPNYKPTQNENVKAKQYKAIGLPEGEVLGKRNFSVKLPIDVEEALLAMEQSERVALVRNLIVAGVRGKAKKKGDRAKRVPKSGWHCPTPKEES